jgi:uncharacterized protein (TIGR02145 family)
MKKTHCGVIVFVLSVAVMFSSCNDRQSAEANGGSKASTDSTDAPDLVDESMQWNAAVAYDSFVDARDGHVYRTVVVGGQTWMAENLAFKPASKDSGWCYDNDSANCATYGRLYTWNEVMGRSLHSRVPGRPQGICPDGWFVPSAAEWDSLVAFVERDPRVGKDKAGTALKVARIGDFPGTDLFGFRALPAGYRKNDGSFLNNGHESYWPSSSDVFRGVTDRSTFVVNSKELPGKYEEYAASVRCLK